MQIYPSGIVPELLALAAFGVAGLASYLVLATWLGLDEPRTLLQLALGRLRQRRIRAGSAS
jgi:hypothetical protein